MTGTRDLTPAQMLTAIAHVQATCPSHGDTTDPTDAPTEDWRSDWDADRAADAEENRRWRGLP